MIKTHLPKILAILLIMLGCSWNNFAQTTTFSYTGGMQTYSVTATGTLGIDMAGAKGGNMFGYATPNLGGNGGRVVCSLAVTAGQVLNIYVGGAGVTASSFANAAGGFNGGGLGTVYTFSYVGGGGGGASDIRIGGTALSDRVIVAGGGGGGSLNCSAGQEGGAGGGTTGGSGLNCGSPTTGGGTQSSGGSGSGGGGSLGNGGDGNPNNLGGGGGGGYYGGGGGYYSGGGGGSSYTNGTYASSVTHTQGYQNGNGYAIITSAGGCTPPSISAGTNVAICNGSSTVLTASGGTTYSWAPSTGLSATSGASVTANPATTTTYTVIGGTGTCTNTATVTVSVNALPNASFGAAPNPTLAGLPIAFTNTGNAPSCGGNALSFNGSSNFASKGSVMTTAVDNITFEAWVKWNGTTTNYQFMFINGNSSSDGYGLIIPPGGNNLIILASGIAFLSSSATLQVGVWQHVAAVRNAGTWSVYLDGTQYSVSFPTVTPLTPTNNFIVGRSQVSTEGFNGTIDEVKFWNTPRSGAEIIADKNLCIAATNANMIGNWKFNEGSGTTTADASGNGNTLTISGASWVSEPANTNSYGWNYGDASTATGASVAHAYSSGGTFTPTLTVTDVNGCHGYATNAVTVNATVAPIIGSPVFCIGDAPDTLTHEISGGTWTSSVPTCASVGLTTGIVTGLAPGYCVITYHIGAGYTQTVSAIVAPLPAAITGPATTCIGSTSGLVGTLGTSSTWSSSNTAIATIGTGSGVVTGIAAGTATMTYTNAYGCYTTREQTINTTPAAISGYTSLCAGSTATLTCTPSGGSWTSSNTGIATVGGTTGIVTGIVSGTANINYILATGCSSSIAVSPLTQPNAITGSLTLCPGGTTTLSSTTTGGTWSTTDGAIATINTTSGVVNAISTGTATMTYTATSGCTRTAVVTVNAAPGASTGNVAMCVGGSITLANAAGGGTWSTSSTSVATVNSSTGVVTGTGAGNANITYTVSGSACYSSVEVTVDAVPAAITGSTDICLGDTAMLTHPVSGGTWSSNHPYRATVDATTGQVIAVSVGLVTITYNTSATCYATFPMVIKALPTTIGGTTTVCEGATTTLTSGPSGGAWTTGNPAIATINASTGVATGVATGTTSVTYTNGCLITAMLSVNTTPAAITGTAATCAGATTTLNCTTSGGSWSSSASGIATVGSSTGIVSGVTTGTTRISYTLPSGCFATVVVTVGTMPATITGTLTLCDGGNVTLLTSATTGGTWSSSATGVATTGTATYYATYVTGISTGTADISYTVGGCSQTATVTVNAGPAAISGSNTLCIGSAATYTNATSGGTWSSSSTAYANIGSSTGIANATSAGVTTISYKTSPTCYSTTAVTVSSAPAAITGSTIVCVGLTTTLSHTTTGGTWSSSASGTATVDGTSGVVTGVATGTATITYTISAGCYKTTTITVYGAPAAIGGTGVACVGATTTLTNTTYGGTWTSEGTAIATVGLTSGVVSGVSDGVATITYQSTSTGCYITKEVTINALPATISGLATVCAGTMDTLTSTTTGGTWTSSAPTIGSVGSTTGIVACNNGGATTITYTLATGCRRTFAITVVNAPATISGTAILCAGNTTTLSSSTASQTWSSSNTSVATVGSATTTTGLVTGAGAGTATISYTNAAGCSRTTVVTVSAPLAANTGDNIVCVGQTIALTNATSGGTWASSTTAKATVGYYTGIVTGVAVGTSNITYKVPSGCLAITQVTVNAALAAITGTTSVCVGQSITLSHSTSGGSWSTSSSTATVDASGVVTGVSAGYAYITYTLTSGCTKVATIIVRALPASITGATSVAVGSYIALTDATSGGTWSSSDAGIASMPYTTLGYVLGVSSGSATITYRVTSTGCFVSYPIYVYSSAARPSIKTNTDDKSSAFSVFPNPTSGALSITAEVDGEFTVYSLDGKLVQQYQVTSGNNSVSLPNDLAAGIYMCRFNGNDGITKMVRLVVEK
jgi:trimeric autotransporter adhesin